MYDVGVAYVLWFLGGFGTLGLHRFYLGNIGTGILWLCTGGLAWFGAFFDLLRMQELVNRANVRVSYERALADRVAARKSVRMSKEETKDSLEKIILRTADAHRGVITPAQVALEADISLDEAQKGLDQLATGGFCEMRVRDTGAIVYRFAEFEISEGPETEI